MAFFKSVKISYDILTELSHSQKICKTMQILKCCGRFFGCVSLTYVYFMQLYMQNIFKASASFPLAEIHTLGRVFI